MLRSCCAGLPLPLLWLDWSCARVVDRYARRRRLRRAAPPGATPRRDSEDAAAWGGTPDTLAEALEATLAPRGSELGCALFPGASADKRTAIARACKAAGVPVFSPHDLRHRRISCSIRRAARGPRSRGVGQRKLSLTADTYTRAQRWPGARLRGGTSMVSDHGLTSLDAGLDPSCRP
jgi:integrase